MDKDLKVKFPAYEEMIVPEALITKFTDLMRGVRFVNSDYVPGQPDDEYERIFIEGGTPTLEYCDAPERVYSKVEYIAMKEQAELVAARLQEDADRRSQEDEDEALSEEGANDPAA